MSLPMGNAFATSASFATPVSLIGIRPVRPGARNTKTPNGLVAFDLAGQPRAGRDLACGRSRDGGARRSLRHERDADSLLVRFDAEDLERSGRTGRHRSAQPSDRPVGANVDACASASTPGSSSTNAPNSARRVTRPERTWPTCRPTRTVDHGSAPNCFSPSAIFCPSPSTRRTLTVISSPGVTIWRGSTRATSPSRRRAAVPARRRPDRRRRRSRAPRRRVRSAPRRGPSSGGSSAALARCSSSSSARRDTTRFLPPSLYSMIRKV